MRLMALAAAMILSAPLVSTADSPWIEVKSAHFVVLSNASDGSTRTLAWQLEQIRSAVTTLWPWARVDAGKPYLVLATKDENGMKLLAPMYWERKGTRPASVWVSGADQQYIAIRADLRGDDRDTMNPYLDAYYSYVGTVLQASFDRRLPLWFLRGLAGVMSNTIVRDEYLLLGPVIPGHLQLLRDQARLSLARLVSTTRESKDYTESERRRVFDAQAWAFVHFLMFGDKGAHEKALGQFAALLKAGKASDVAFAEALGPVDEYEKSFDLYFRRNLFGYQKVTTDVGVKREGFAARAVAPAEAAAARAAFHVAMRRPIEARAAIDEGRKADPSLAALDVAEGLLLDADGKRDEAKASFAKAVDRDSANAYAHYRFAILSWGRTEPDGDTLLRIEKSLTRAVALNTRYAAAYAALGEARAALKQTPDVVVGLVRRAISLEPSEPSHHLSAARVFYRLKMDDDARKEAQTALALAEDDRDRQDAEQLLKFIEQARKPGN